MAKQERTILKKVANAILYSDGSIRLDNVRLSYPFIGTPSEDENDDGKSVKKWRVVAMLPKTTHLEAKNLIKERIQQSLKDASSDKANPVKVPIENWCLQDGDKLAEGDEKKEVYAGHWVLTVSETRRPTARKRSGEVMTPEEADELFYGGCWANLQVSVWYFNGKAKNGKTYPKRVPGKLHSIQFLRDDDAFGEGRIDDEGVWEGVEDDGKDGMDDDDDL